MNNDYNKSNVAIVIGIILLIMVPTFFFGSTDKVDTTEVAFKRNKISGKVDFSRTYDTGFYWKGFFNKFIKFDTTLQTIEMKEGSILSARTKDGLSISLDVSFQYRIQPDNAQLIYMDYLLKYEDTYLRVARDSIRDVCSVFNAIDFFNNRTYIGDVMFEQVSSDLNTLYADVGLLQLRNVDLPDSFEKALENVEIARQEYEVALREQEAAIIRADTKVIEAAAAAQVQVIGATATAESYVIEMQAIAEGLNITLAAEADAIYALGQTLGLNNTELLSYLWIKAITEHDSAYLIIGENTPLLLNPTG